jgi:hypothetical protein
MKGPLTAICAGMFFISTSSWAQPPAANSAAPASSSPSSDAVYPKPSGQDSQPSSKPQQTQAKAPKAASVESRGTKSSDQSSAVQPVAKQKAYTGNTGKKADPGTACSTARTRPDGTLDCGTSGVGATPGKIPK